jgi:uncharacterized protein YdcH (DUF465 family)
MTEKDENILREQLMNSEPEFRSLARKHQKLENRLAELNSLHFPTDREQLEEQTIKREKLEIKDQMQGYLNRH